eukprot:TRINITY_DN27051_c0_g2_i1.p1 TRINITY_DN27051_c0_g2~~TRINITY_DN27051_c0_g2_i1.p1  ORF type:complete len:549 (+),score=48.43 TRINITY_DN27051_c0_g2_i1:218-1864(+)
MARKIDPADGRLYSFEEFSACYGSRCSQRFLLSYWAYGCKPTGKRELDVVDFIKSHLAFIGQTHGGSWMDKVVSLYLQCDFQTLGLGDMEHLLRRHGLWVDRKAKVSLDLPSKLDIPCRAELLHEMARAHSMRIAPPDPRMFRVLPTYSYLSPMKIAAPLVGTQSYTGEIFVVSGHEFEVSIRERFKRAVSLHPMVGVDCEWKPDRKYHQDNFISLLSVATVDCVYLFRTKQPGAMWLPECVREVLMDPAVCKVVVAPLHDRQKMKLSFWLDLTFDEPEGFLDLANLGREIGHMELGLRSLAAWYELDIRKAADITTSDWERPQLTQKQIEYAAEDVWIPLMLVGLMLTDRESSSMNRVRRTALHAWHNGRELLHSCFRRLPTKEDEKVGKMKTLLATREPQQVCSLPGAASWVKPPNDGLTKAWYKEHRNDFAILEGQKDPGDEEDYLVRARTEVELEMPSAAEVQLWQEKLVNAREPWLRDMLQRHPYKKTKTHNNEFVDFLNYRLRRIADMFYARRQLLPYRAVRSVSITKKGLSKAKSEMLWID